MMPCTCTSAVFRPPARRRARAARSSISKSASCTSPSAAVRLTRRRTTGTLPPLGGARGGGDRLRVDHRHVPEGHLEESAAQLAERGRVAAAGEAVASLGAGRTPQALALERLGHLARDLLAALD